MSRARGAYPWLTALPTRWADNDPYGHLNNATYFSLFDTALTLWQIESGVLGDGPDAPRMLVVETGCRFFQELRFPDLLHAGLRCSRIGRSSFTIELALFRGAAEEAAATGFFAQVQVDAKSHRPLPLDAPRRALLKTIG
ncbi:thioesterase family protein [Marinovum sp.]|uniref:acyl-CoA thioesterase n=1 Tax=Marinovum sp. TaxID=2024839 RepID=UPI002B2737EC|nr:thioesterase family protein [Marinovum sp.]